MFDLLCAILVLVPLAGFALYVTSIALALVYDLVGDIIGGTLWVISFLCGAISSAAKGVMLRLRRQGRS